METDDSDLSRNLSFPRLPKSLGVRPRGRGRDQESGGEDQDRHQPQPGRDTHGGSGPLVSPDQKEIDKVIEKLRTEREMELNVEDDVAGFLGVNIGLVEGEDGSKHLELTQVGLIDRIIPRKEMRDRVINLIKLLSTAVAMVRELLINIAVVAVS